MLQDFPTLAHPHAPVAPLFFSCGLPHTLPKKLAAFPRTPLTWQATFKEHGAEVGPRSDGMGLILKKGLTRFTPFQQSWNWTRPVFQDPQAHFHDKAVHYAPAGRFLAHRTATRGWLEREICGPSKKPWPRRVRRAHSCWPSMASSRLRLALNRGPVRGWGRGKDRGEMEQEQVATEPWELPSSVISIKAFRLTTTPFQGDHPWRCSGH